MARKSTRSRKPDDPWAEAIQHLRQVDPRCAALIERIGPCRLRPRPDRFGTLVRAIIGQQISSKAAASIDHRLRALGSDPHRPEVIAALDENGLKSAGLSSNKARSVLELSDAVIRGDLPLDEIDSWDDESILNALTKVRGIGPWTAEMFLIFALNRPDVMPGGDLGVRAAMRKLHGLDEIPKPHECRTLAELWRPYRTIAIWYLWADLDTPPPMPEEP
jgi:DNA-3-methyladenine glycosylase II